MTDCTKIINDISRNWKLTNAQYANDGPDHKAGEKRTDGRYPTRIGSTYTCLSFVGVGRSVIMPYLKDFMGVIKPAMSQPVRWSRSNSPRSEKMAKPSSVLKPLTQSIRWWQ